MSKAAEPMKYVFLDIDGVLNSREFFEREKPLKKFEEMKAARAKEDPGLGLSGRSDEYWDNYNRSLCHIGEEYVERLNGLAFSGVCFILSSTWRMQNPLHHVQSMLTQKGFQGLLLGSTPVSAGKRGREIATWLQHATGADMFDMKAKIMWPDFVILDDDSDMLHLEPRLVKTSNDIGLQNEDVLKARDVLGLG